MDEVEVKHYKSESIVAAQGGGFSIAVALFLPWAVAVTLFLPGSSCEDELWLGEEASGMGTGSHSYH